MKKQMVLHEIINTQEFRTAIQRDTADFNDKVRALEKAGLNNGEALAVLRDERHPGQEAQIL